MEKKKLNGRTILVASALFIAIFAQVGFLGSVMGPEGQQHNIWGTTSKAGNSPPGLDISTNRTITAWIDGVSYGYNWTTTSGSYDLYVDGDAWGVPVDNALKDGGWDGDLIYYFIDYDPMNYYLDISSHTSTFDPSSYELVDPIYFDTQTEIDNAADTYLRAVKINEVVVTPGDGLPQYVILYDSGGDLSETAIENNYYLEKDDSVAHDPQGPVFDFSLNPQYVEAYGTDYYYINLTGFNLNAQDELKLVWENPGTTVDNICNGSDVIVDRVEWGNYINYINPVTPPDDRDYDNTTMIDYPNAPAVGQCIRRTTNGTDTDNCGADFTQQTRSPRIAPPLEPVAYIQIRTAPGGGGINLCDPGNYPSYAVGFITTFYGAAYSAAGVYLGAVEVTSTWISTDGTIVSVTPTGTQTTVTCDNQNWGTVTITLNDGLGHVNTTQVTVLQPTVDYIEITDTPGGTPLSGGNVGSGYIEWGYCSGYNNTAGYIGVFSGDWSNEGGNSALTNSTPNIHNGINVGTTTADVWLNVTYLGKTDSVMYTVTGGGVPGAPTDLRVHKGGGAWGGSAGDIVLEWMAPTVDYGFLVANIVYYDMDITNGYQYTNWIIFAPNNTGAGTADGCILPGWDADTNNYAFIVRTTGDTQGGLENLTGTNIGYKYIMTLQKNPMTPTQFMWISIPYFSDYKMASDICGPTEEFIDNTVIDSLVKWNFTSQQYDKRYYSSFPPPAGWKGDFAINPGDSLGLIITEIGSYDWSIVGSYDESLQFELLKNPMTATQFMTLSLPYHKTYVFASDICGPAKEFPDATYFDSLVQWNFTSQQYDKRYYSSFPPPAGWKGDFALTLSPGDALGMILTADSAYYWTPEVIVV